MAALCTAPLLGLLLAVAPTAHAAPDPDLTITDVDLSKPAVAVSGLNLAPVDVTVKAGYDSSNPADDDITLVVMLERTSGTGPLDAIFSTSLKRTSGQLQNGVWTGRLNVPSTANGTFAVTGVMTGPYGYPASPMNDPTPFAGPALAVTGYNLPSVTAAVSPKVVPFGSPFSIRWAVTNSATGKPYGSRIPVRLGIDTGCVEGIGGPLVRTGTDGIVTKSYAAADAKSVLCLQMLGDPFVIKNLGLVVAKPGIVSASPSKTSAPVGTVVPVNGSVAGAPWNCKVWLQRQYGATQWRSVGSGAVRTSGRFTLSAQPAYKGLIPYRAYMPTCGSYQAGISKAFYIRGL